MHRHAACLLGVQAGHLGVDEGIDKANEHGDRPYENRDWSGKG